MGLPATQGTFSAPGRATRHLFKNSPYLADCLKAFEKGSKKYQHDTNHYAADPEIPEGPNVRGVRLFLICNSYQGYTAANEYASRYDQFPYQHGQLATPHAVVKHYEIVALQTECQQVLNADQACKFETLANPK